MAIPHAPRPHSAPRRAPRVDALGKVPAGRVCQGIFFFFFFFVGGGGPGGNGMWRLGRCKILSHLGLWDLSAKQVNTCGVAFPGGVSEAVWRQCCVVVRGPNARQ
jgi:hypothetical protein